jgi:DNA-binding transcriptional LysR family regulator
MEGIASCYLAPRIDQFAARAPKLKVELFSNPHIVDLLKKETDIFISFFNPRVAGLVSKKIGECAVHVYASKKYEERYGLPKSREQLRHHQFVSYINEMVTIGSVRWLEELVSSPNVVFSSNSIISQMNAAQSGIGLVVLPSFVGNTTRMLFRLLPDQLVLHRPIWLSVTRDRSGLPSIRSAVAIISALFADE